MPNYPCAISTCVALTPSFGTLCPIHQRYGDVLTNSVSECADRDTVVTEKIEDLRDTMATLLDEVRYLQGKVERLSDFVDRS